MFCRFTGDTFLLMDPPIVDSSLLNQSLLMASVADPPVSLLWKVPSDDGRLEGPRQICPLAVLLSVTLITLLPVPLVEVEPRVELELLLYTEVDPLLWKVTTIFGIVFGGTLPIVVAILA